MIAGNGNHGSVQVEPRLFAWALPDIVSAMVTPFLSIALHRNDVLLGAMTEEAMQKMM